METQKFNSNNNARGGKNNTKTILTAAGLSAVAGVATGAVAFKLGLKPVKHDDKPTEDHVETPTVAENVQQQAAQQQTQQQPQQAQQQTVQQQPTNGDDITTPQPIDSNTGGGSAQQPDPQNGGQTQTAQTGGQTPDGDDVDPDLIAQQIANSNETDPTDIEAPDLISVDGFDVAYAPDGSEIPVAHFHTPDGSEYVLADIDGDGIFSDVFDTAGNYVGSAEGNLTASDLEEAADPTGGYMAYRDDHIVGDDPTQDIIETDHYNDGDQPIPGHDDVLVAENEEDEADLEELLAQLLDSNEDSTEDVANREMVMNDDIEDDDDDEPEEEDDDDDDDDDDNDVDDLDDDEA